GSREGDPVAGKRFADCLGSLSQRMEATSGFRSDSQFTRYRDADLKFHQTIAEMTGNLLYVHVFHFFLDLVRRSISLSRQLLPGNFAKDNLRNHEEIYRAIEKKDPERAKRAMLEHFRYVEQHISPSSRRVSSHHKKPALVRFRGRDKFS